MKIIELDLKKKVLIVDENDFGYYTNIDNEIIFHLGNVRLRRIKGNFKLLCKGSELTEEIASELCHNIGNCLTIEGNAYLDDEHDEDYFEFAKDAFISAVESKDFYWLENLLCEEKPKCYNLPLFKIEKRDNKLLKWQEAEEKTFKNPLIFVKNA